jgi:integrase
MFERTDRWVSSGCHTKREAILWAEAKLRNSEGLITKPVHKEYTLARRRGRNIQVQFNGSDSWLSSGFSDEINATLWADSKLRERKRNNMTLGEFSEGFFTRTDEMSFRAKNIRKERKYNDQYYLAMNGRLQNYIIPKFGDVYLNMLTHLEIDKWFVTLKKATTGKALSPDSKNKVFNCLSMILKEAFNQGIIDSNPCDSIDSIAEKNKSRMAFTEEEMILLFPERDDELLMQWGGLMWTSYFLIMKCTGFRPGEIAGLTIHNYYKSLGGIYTSQSVNSYTRDIVKRIKTTDSGIKSKIGLLSEQCCRFVDKLIENLPIGEEYLFKINDHFIITDTSNKHFRLCAGRVIELKGRTQYSLRHTFQTMIAGEIERGSIEELMGHTKYREGYDHRAGEKRLKQLQGLRETLNKII